MANTITITSIIIITPSIIGTTMIITVITSTVVICCCPDDYHPLYDYTLAWLWSWASCTGSHLLRLRGFVFTK